jgi:ubiquitin carboxyl-terminal hydrolase 8
LGEETYKAKLKKAPESALLVEWDELRKMLWSDNCIISPGKFIKTIQKVAQIKGVDLFTGFSQNDLPEFLLFLIDCFHTSLSREIRMTISGTPSNTTDNIAIQCFEMIKKMYSKEYSEIWNLFYAVHVSEISDLKTGESLKITPEPYFILDLPIPAKTNSTTLIDCFNLYVEGEILEGENGWINDATKERIDIRKKIQFWSFPNILVIDLKRFNARFQKSQVLVTFPIDNLDLSEYVIGYKRQSYKYELYGVCNHSGGVMGGHYTAYVKNANGKWYHFNDTSVSEVGLPDSIVSPKAYVLFYRKKAN